MGELDNALKSINIENLNADDKKELIKIFMVTNNPGVRNRIALIFSDLNYEDAIPYIIKKINDKNIFNQIGTLVYSLENMEVKKYFLTFIWVICEHEYEPRLSAYEIIEKHVNSISPSIRKKAIQILKDRQLIEEQKENNNYENSILHFVDATLKLLVGDCK